MREFEVNLSKSLAKGLRPFPRNELSGSFLYECYNFMPSETGLIPYETVRAIGSYFNYLEIKDQLGVSWYWYPVFDGHILAGSSIPSEPSTGLDAVAITPTPTPYWVNVLDELGATWRLYPDSTTGETRAKDSDPSVGTGMNSLRWRGTTQEMWELAFRVSDHTRYAVRV